MALKFKCNHCDTEIISKFLKVGEEAKCKFCGTSTLIPDNAEEVDDDKYTTKLKKVKIAPSVNNDKPATIKQSKKLKYPNLNTISGIYKFLAVLAGIVSVIGLFYGLYSMTQYGAKFDGIGIIVYSLITGPIVVISLLAASELIKLSILIENNTSEQNKLLGKLINKIK
jgi:hypothetical protein